jgi:transcriptional/translational regulatory protein YebC/TACO1
MMLHQQLFIRQNRPLLLLSATIARPTQRNLAGHNKWSKIRHKKASNDKTRAALYSKASRAIEAASRSCSGDLSDLHLQSAIAAGRAVQLPKERRDKAIERGRNPNVKEGELIVRRYDGMIPAGPAGKVAVIVEALTENRNRTAANVRHMITKVGGELLPTGANDWLFTHVGLIYVSKYFITCDPEESKEEQVKVEVDIDKLLECALEAGATDVDIENDTNDDTENDTTDDANSSDQEKCPIIVKCEPNNLISIVKTLQQEGYTTNQFETQWLIKEEDNRVKVEDEGVLKFEKFLEAADVFHNAQYDVLDE